MLTYSESFDFSTTPYRCRCHKIALPLPYRTVSSPLLYGKTSVKAKECQIRKETVRCGNGNATVRQRYGHGNAEKTNYTNTTNNTLLSFPTDQNKSAHHDYFDGHAEAVELNSIVNKNEVMKKSLLTQHIALHTTHQQRKNQLKNLRIH